MTLDDKKDKVMRPNYTSWSSRDIHSLNILEKDVADLVRKNDTGFGLSKRDLAYLYSRVRTFGIYEDPKINRRVRWLVNRLESLMREKNMPIPYIKSI